jgi:hypothetical protein
LVTFDAFRSDDGEITLIVTGAASAPVVASLETGLEAVMVPARFEEGDLPGISRISTDPTGGVWLGTLAGSPAATCTRLRPDFGDHTRHLRVYWDGVAHG